MNLEIWWCTLESHMGLNFSDFPLLSTSYLDCLLTSPHQKQLLTSNLVPKKVSQKPFQFFVVLKSCDTTYQKKDTDRELNTKRCTETIIALISVTLGEIYLNFLSS